MRKRGRTIPPLGLLMVDVKEAAAMLSIGESTVWKKVKEDPSFPQPGAPQPKVHEVQGRRYQEVGEIRRYGSLSVSLKEDKINCTTPLDATIIKR